MRLRRSDHRQAGIRRRRAGRGFVYVDDSGVRVTDAEILERIGALAIPPAWENVWVCPWVNGHIQAVGTDARGRRQYRYHDEWRVQQDREKFEHMLDVARVMPAVRAACTADLALEGMPKARVLGCAGRLLDLGFFRIGGEEYAEENGTFGLATMLKRHARIDGTEIVFDYPGKTGRRRIQSVADPDVLTVVDQLKRRRGGGPELLAYKEGGRWIDVRSSDVNCYLQEVAGIPISAKDFRTWNATILAAVGFALAPPARSERTARRVAAQVMRDVSEHLGNTPAVCRSSYVDPRVVDMYVAGETIGGVSSRRGEPDRASIEAAVLDLLAGDAAEAVAA